MSGTKRSHQMTLIKKTKFIPELIKPRISFFVALTAGTGYALAKSHFDISMIFTVTGIFLLACGSSVLNHLQEFQTDAKMERTKNRPLAASKISKEFTIATVLFLLVAGYIVLVVFSGAIPTIAGLSGVLWYNFVYTPLKKRLVFAVIPGSIAGAVPSVAGWLAGHGDFLSYQFLISVCP
jgi:heme o synthase